MKTPVLLFAASLALAAPAPALAGSEIARACRATDRPAATRALCSCLQGVADTMLTRAERRRVAHLLGAPHLSQEVRASDKPADARFWTRYRAYGEAAHEACQ